MGNLALIPARSGSKGLIHKNIKPIHGKPLLVYSIEAAKASGIFDEIYVSTDSKDYADIAVQYGASVPFLRSPENSTDTASSWDVVKEALRRYEEISRHFDMVTLLQPTTPLRTGEDILGAFEIFRNDQANSVVSVCEMDHSPLWSNTLPEDRSLCNFIRPEVMNKQRQKLDTYYRINGAIYMVATKYLLECSNIYEANSIAYIMDRERSIDIDNALDFTIAEAIMSNMQA